MSDDSNEPITGEWLETIGFQRYTTQRGTQYCSRGFLTLTPHGVEFVTCPLPHIQTRGQMRDAVRVLLGSVDGWRAE